VPIAQELDAVATVQEGLFICVFNGASSDMSEQSLLSLYHSEACRIRGTGHAKDEVSFYPVLEMTFNRVGRSLKPAVVAIQHPKGRQGDHPDLGLFEFGHAKAAADWLKTPIPSRGVVEAKPLSYDIDTLQASMQVSDYLKNFGAVLITNFREFRLLALDGKKMVVREQLVIASSEASFWALNTNNKRVATGFSEFIHRVLLNNAPLRTPEDVAFFLASYARGNGRTGVARNSSGGRKPSSSA
jgi:hypothetical protein